MQTIKLKNNTYLLTGYSIVGPLEGKGPLKDYFDYILKDDTLGEKTFEKSERKLLEKIVRGAIDKSGLRIGDIDFFFGGDLLNQIVSSSYTARELELPFVGLYSACATMAESIALASLFVDNDLCNIALASTCSHFSSAERQYRFPLELGNQRAPTTQWTITGGGATIISKFPTSVKIVGVTFGRVIDFGVADVNNMGAAMAPAACDTICAHLKNMKRKSADYDFIATGDLGKLGSEILIDLLEHEGVILGKNYQDCGCMMYDKIQRVFMGGSGAGCSASIFNSYILKKLSKGEFKRVLLVSTGALMSTTTSQQGDTIPGIAHAVEFEFVAKNLQQESGNVTFGKTKSKRKNMSNNNKHENSNNNKNSTGSNLKTQQTTSAKEMPTITSQDSKNKTNSKAKLGKTNRSNKLGGKK